MAGKIGNRQWFIVRRPRDTEILYLFSAFSKGHIRRAKVLDDHPYIIERAKRWHVSLVFSGLPRFGDYRTRYGSENVECYAANEFHMKSDEICPMVKVIG